MRIEYVNLCIKWRKANRWNLLHTVPKYSPACSMSHLGSAVLCAKKEDMMVRKKERETERDREQKGDVTKFYEVRAMVRLISTCEMVFPIYTTRNGSLQWFCGFSIAIHCILTRFNVILPTPHLLYT